MSNIELIRESLEYNTWANNMLLSSLIVADDAYNKELTISFGSIHHLLSHITYYEVLAYEKIVRKRRNPDISKKYSKIALFEILKTYSTKWLDWVKTLSENSQARIEQHVFNELLILCNHSNYHRGQIHCALSMLGYQPKSLDIYVHRNQLSCDTIS